MISIPEKIDVIWNISLVCPWDCEFCCTDAVHVTRENGEIIARERSLRDKRIVRANDSIRHFHGREIVSGIEPSPFDLVMWDRQIDGLELTYEQKLRVLENIDGVNAEIDFAGGEPLACYENYLVIKEAAKKFGRENISITSTGVFIKKYGAERIAEIIGKYEFTLDEVPDGCSVNRPFGYNALNIHSARIFSSLGIKTKAQLPIHGGNIRKDAIEKIFMALYESGIDELLLMRTFPVGRGASHLARNAVSRQEILGSIECFRELEAKYGRPRVRLQCALQHLSTSVGRNNPCDLMSESYGINCRGDLLVSAWANGFDGQPLDDAFVLGRISDEKFVDIMRSQKAQRYMSRLNENFGHCKIFSFLYSDKQGEDAIFSRTDPLYKQ